MFCTNCGKAMNQGDVFCVECGTKAEQVEITVQAQQVLAPVSVADTSQSDVVKKSNAKIFAIGATVVVLVLVVVFVLPFSGGSNLNGRWEAGSNAYEFSGRNFTRISREVVSWRVLPPYGFVDQQWGEVTRDGTFSISDDQIEFVYADGNIVVHSFSRTDNTITIGRQQFTRAG